MNGIFDDDTSTDDEIGVNLQLAERLRINRSEHSSKEQSLIPKWEKLNQFYAMQQYDPCLHMNRGSPSSYHSDGSVPPTQSPYLLPNKKRQNGDKNQENFAKSKRTCLGGRFNKCSPFQKMKKKNSKDPPTKSAKPFHSHRTSELNLSPDKTYESHSDNELNLLDFDDSDSDFSSQATKARKRLVKNHPPVSSSNYCACNNPPRVAPSRDIDSDSDDSSKTFLKNGALKGGRQSRDCVQPSGRVTTSTNRILDSDDTEEDNWQAGYRSRPISFSSSESEDSKSTKHPQALESTFTIGGAPSSALDKRLSSTHEHFKPSSFMSGPSSGTIQKHAVARPLKSRILGDREEFSRFSRQSSTKTGNPEQTLQASPSHRRGRAQRTQLFLPKTIPPHLRTRSSRRFADEARSTAERAQTRTSELLSKFPDIFDAEDSSEVEFFTANSYSDTETSNESLGTLTLNASVTSQPKTQTSIACEQSVNVGSSEDEISVVFNSTEARRGTPRAAGRRYSRGAPRYPQNTQEVVSLSPDPVEQVRQMEEDERMARILQAQFDAEVDPRPNYVHVPEPLPSSSIDSDDDEDDEIIDPVGDSDSDAFPPPPMIYRRHGGSFTSGRSPSSFVFFNRPRIRSRNRRRFADQPFSFQISRAVGLHFTADDYEALLQLAEQSGEAGQRGLQKTEINRLPTRKFVDPNSSSSSSEVTHKRTELNKECQVCLNDYEPGDVLRILPCFHEFHTPCIDPWLKINHTCPVCRVVVDLEE